jgi:uncharacterized protein (DUF488 family)
MGELYTIGFTQKTAKKFFSLLKNNKIDAVIDIRLNNTSQLAGFSKYPDIEYFLNDMLNIKYIHDPEFSPTENILKEFKEKKISWNEYTKRFNELMAQRNIRQYIQEKYIDCQSIKYCLLCSENEPEQCHRSLVSAYFCEIFKQLKVINL